MNVIELLNTIRDNGSAQYQNRVPEATRTNCEDLRMVFIDEDNISVANEFMSTLLNKCVKTVVIAKQFSNPLKALKKGKKPLGDTVEEIYVNFLKGSVYDPEGKELLSRTLPDVKTVYHRMNYKMKYKVTVNQTELSKAFMSYDALEKFISNIIASLHNSAELDEFINMKQIVASAIEQNAMKTIEIADPALSEANAKDFITAVKTISGLMVFPAEAYNGYLNVQTTDTKPITTFSRYSEQVLILDTATNTKVAVDVLASTFNMSVAEFNETKKIVIDTFPDPDVRAVIVDEQFFQIFDDAIFFKAFENPDGMYNNYWLHVWQTIAYSPLVNAVAFKVATA